MTAPSEFVRRSLFFFVLIPLILTCSALALPRAQPIPAKTQPTQGKTGRSRNQAAEAARQNNLGVAYMNQQRFDQALKLFEQAYTAEPGLYLARINQGIALLNLRRLKEARAVLEEVARRSPRDPHVWFNLGLLDRSQSRFPQAVEDFGRVTVLDRKDPDTQYFLGVLYTQLARYDEGIEAFHRALELAPFHASAEFGLARAYQRKGDTAAAREHLARFQKLTQEKLGQPIGSGYGDQGKYSLAEQAVFAAPPVPPAIPVRFVPVAEEAGLRGLTPGEGAFSSGAGACFFDFDGDGRPDLFLVNGGPKGSGVLLRNAGGGRFVDVTRQAGLDVRGAGQGCAAGDYDNDGRTDLAVAFRDGVRLFRNQGDGTFRDVTEKAGIRPEPNPVSVTFVDYDHDGDLDLYIVRGPRQAGGGSKTNRAGESAERNILWRNNGNGTFTEWSEPTGLGIVGEGGGIVSVDIDNDRAVDLVMAGSPAKIFFNPHEGRFRPMPVWDPQKEKLPPAVGVVAFDFDKDGWMDLAFTHAGPPGLTLWRNVEGRRFERVPLPDLNWKEACGLAVLDYDNDGWLDLAVVGEGPDGGEVRLLRNLGMGRFGDVSRDVGLDRLRLAHPVALVATDYDADGDSDLLLTQAGGPPVLLRNDGGNRNNWLRLSLKSLADNKIAIGTKVEVYAGPLYQKWEVAAASGYLGQGETEILAGLGSAKEADVVRLLWPTGVPQDEIQLAARATHALTELDRRGSSCPLLFAWNGRRFEFIADMIGPGIVGHWIGPGERNVADPTEYLKIGGAQLRSHNGRLSLRFMEAMEEVVYLDQVRLLAIDHPAEVMVLPNERFVSEPPFPEFKVIASRGARLPLGAWDDYGRDVLAELRERDRRYVTGFASLPFTGFAEKHVLELDLGPWSPSAPLRLLMHGYTDYFTATSMYAAWQAGVNVEAPYVEALDSTGQWARVVDDLGFPAGLLRTMVADLTGRLPAGTRRIRIVTNLKIYWDQILIDTTPDSGAHRISEIPLAEAKLNFRGYPRERRGKPASDISYVYEEVSRTGPFFRGAGNYTRYGDVTSLLKEADDKFVIFGSGDEIQFEFDSTHLPSLPPGWTRDYFFFADGFTKDMDFYASYGNSVEPLPYHTMLPYPYPPAKGFPGDDAHFEYQLEYNTRESSGRAAPSFRFQYPPEKKSSCDPASQ